jgi:uncharacterized iron-regulated membrane protein
MIRWLFLLHRYLGISVGALMVIWCVSGVVMMYVSYPELGENGRLRQLAPIAWSGCCKISSDVLADDAPVTELQVEMLGDRAVLYLRGASQPRLIDLATGVSINQVSSAQAAAVARLYTRDAARAPRLLGLIDADQWTVAGDFNADRPLYRFSLDDEKRTEVYVSSVTGRAVQLTNARERLWNWLGAVPHWLYFTELRRHATLWSQVMVATSLVGCFLAATGIFIGVRQLIHRPAGSWSPYRGFNLWHHIAGLVFGLFALSWVLSGLLSMNPWGWLEGADSQAERARLRGRGDLTGAQIKGALATLVRSQPSDVVSLKIAPLEDRLYIITTAADGERRRLNADADLAPLTDRDLSYVAGVLGGATAAPVATLMTREDAYYFSHHRDIVRLPVYRVVLGEGTRYYVDTVAGTLVAKIDPSAQAYRWWHEGLHRMDFSAALRGRPQWDFLMLALMCGVTFLCGTGTYLGYRRLVRRHEYE